MGRFLRHLPRIKHLRGSWLHRAVGDRMLDSHLWAFERGSVSLGFAIGAFFCLMPAPFQMLPAAFVAVLVRANVPAALVGCWITNPFTIPIFLYAQYAVGSRVLGLPPIMDQMGDYTLMELVRGAPGVLVVGWLVLGVALGAGGWLLARLTYDLCHRALLAGHSAAK